MDIFVARQPIFDQGQEVFGYELLYRSGREPRCTATDGDRATIDVIRNMLLSMGAAELTCGKKAFINFTRTLLVGETPYFLPRDISVIEVLEDVVVDAEVVAACRKLHEKGYTLALDDVLLGDGRLAPLIDLVDFVKVDVLGDLRTSDTPIIRELCSRGLHVLAEKVETRERFVETKGLGFTFFQGYFFSKPELISRTAIPAQTINCLRLINEINTPPFEVARIERIVRQDTALVLRLLKYMNSAFFGFAKEITSIRHALVLLGEKEVRKWISLIALTQLAGEQSLETLRLSLVRAAFCESVAPLVGMREQKAELFLLGMLSMIDVFVGRPLAEVVGDIPLAQELKAALLGEQNAFRRVFDLAVSYEKGLWEEVGACADALCLPREEIPDAYLRAVQWAENALDVKESERA